MATELESSNEGNWQTERRLLLVEWNQTQRVYPQISGQAGQKPMCLHQHFEAQVAQTPEALAITFEDIQLTFKALDGRANQLAHVLQKLGVGPEVLVGIYLERSIEFVVGMLAILKAGGAYVPFDPAYPSERIVFMLKDMQAPVMLTRQHLVTALSSYSGFVLCLDSDWEKMSQQDRQAPYSAVVADNLAYTIYTSGSTGQPKGVQVSHRNLLNMVLWYQETYRPEVGDRMSHMAALAFDGCIWEIWPTLTAGACLHIPLNSVRLSLTALPRWLIEQGITLLYLPTPLAEAFLALPWEEGSYVRILSIGGDKLRRTPTQALPCQLWDCYGPAESTVTSIAGEVATGPDITPIASIGRPIANTTIYLLSPSLDPVPLGEMGELYISGAGLSRGYLHQPDLTAERFLPNPFSLEQGTRFYRTGDLARYHADGTVEYIGRVDHQVKVRGFRIELGEIEATLLAHQSVREAVIVAYENAGEKHLVAYVVPASQEPPLSIEELRHFVQERLPAYMVPALFVLLAALPLSLNGKLDRAALPPPIWGNTADLADNASNTPRTPTEIMLAQICAEVLPVKQVGRNDQIFLLGGHSLLAMQILSRLNARLQREIPLDVLFMAPTLAELASYLDGSGSIASAHLEHAMPPLHVREREISPTGEMFAPLSFAQQSLWLHDQMEPGNPSYNVLTALRLHGHLHVIYLERSLHILVQRHEILRTTFSMKANQPVQVIAPTLRITVPLIDISEMVEEAEQWDEVKRQSKLEASHAFHLACGPLLRVTLFRLGVTEHVLLVNMHHIISDGWSTNVLIQELGDIYTASLSPEVADPATVLPTLPYQYADYTGWQREWMQEQDQQEDQETPFKRHLEYWKQQLATAPALLELPTDYPRPMRQTYRGASASLFLDQSLVQQLRTVSQKLTTEAGSGGYTLFMILLAVFHLLLLRLTGEEDIVVGTPFANRNRPELEGLIGFFVNTLMLRINLSGDPPFRELLERVQRKCLEAYAHQDVPFDRILEELRPERDLSHTPLFQVFFNLLNMVNHPVLEWPELHGEVFWPQQAGAKFDLTLYAQETEQGILLEALYNADLFTVARVQEMLEEMRYLLSQVVVDPEKHLSQFSLVTAASRAILPDPTEMLSTTWEGSVTDLFSVAAQRFPENLAVSDVDGEWSYQALDEQSNRLANYLCMHGIQAQDTVAIYAYRNADLVCAILGVLKAGAAYVILDPAYPASRLVTYFRLAHTRGFIQLEAAGPLPSLLQEVVSVESEGCRLLLSRQCDELQGFLATAPLRTVGPHDIACIAFTSGSTGQPKGVLQEHGSLTHFLPWLQQAFNLNEHDRHSMLSGLAHDPLQRDIFTPLCLGATLCVPSPENIHSPGWLAAWMRRERISITNLTPAMLRLLTQIPASLPEKQEIPSLRYAFIVGDQLTRSDVHSLQRIAPALTCVNLFGTTETQRAGAYFICPRQESSLPEYDSSRLSVPVAKERIPLGRGWKDAQLLVLNRANTLAGIGEPGEICIRSPHLARGYLDNEALTRERFVVNPFTQKEDDRIYRTGDLGRYLPSGDVEHIGRNDQQVKLRGFRIELGEIEVALQHHPAISAAVAIVREDTPGDKSLVAYLVLETKHVDQEALLQELRQILSQRLPVYMLPSRFVILEALPLLPNHKINRQALPAPSSITPDVARRSALAAPRNAREEILLDLWKQALKVEQLGIHENFFELGGHSLLAMQLLANILDTFQVVLSLRALFEAPTVASFATVLEQHGRREGMRKQPALLTLARRPRRTGGRASSPS